jgi:hypothetical protein
MSRRCYLVALPAVSPALSLRVANAPKQKRTSWLPTASRRLRFREPRSVWLAADGSRFGVGAPTQGRRGAAGVGAESFVAAMLLF